MQAKQAFELRTAAGNKVTVLWFAEVAYAESHQAMLNYASQRTPQDDDVLWLLEHPSVYTQGTACDLGTFISSDIPLLKTDRGGQITYHGPGQIVMYPLLHLKNHHLGVKALVNALEQSAIEVLADYQLSAVRRENAPGVYIDDAKIAALGLRIRRGNSYHGLSLNVDMDLTPFNNIDPCGYHGLRVTQLSDHQVNTATLEVGKSLAERFVQQL